ncbi:MAG: hypothetical protein AB7E96_07160 [Deferribacterales bacterium]
MKTAKIQFVIYPVLVGVFLAWFVTGALRYFVSAPQTDTTGMKHERVRQDGGMPDFGLIRRKNIFKADVSAVKDTLDAVGFSASSAPDSAPAQQSLRLSGILKGTYMSYVILKADGKNLVLKQGVEKEGYRLKTAYDDHAEIETENGLTTVYLESSKVTVDSSGGKMPVNTDKVTMPRKELVGKLSNINSVMKAVMITPFERKGKFVGYRLTKMKPDSALARLGLVSGDVIIRLNGKELKDPAIFFDALSNTENLSSITIDLERNSAKKTIYVEII